MKKNIIWLAGCLLLLSACNNSKYDLENLVPEEYHKILYINNSGKQEMVLYDTNEDYTYTLSVIKAGSAPAQTAEVDINILTQEELDNKYSIPEAINYKLLTEDSYSLEATKMTFASEDHSKSVHISVNSTKVKELMTSEPDTRWVLPLNISSSKDSISHEMNELFLQITDVIMPSIGFILPEEDDTEEHHYGSVPQIDKEVEISLDTENKWAISCEIGTDENYIDTYNEANKAVFKMLPEGSYTIPESAELTEGTTSVKLKVSINGTKIDGPGDYMLPIAIKSTSKFQLSGTTNIYPIKIRIVGEELNRTGWTATANSEEATGEGSNGKAQLALDGDLNTYWHSIWQNGSGVRALPYEIIIDTKAEHTFSQFGMIQRSVSFMDTKSGEIYISLDNSNWEKVGTFTLKQNMEKQIFSVVSAKGRYVKIKITSSYRDQNCSLTEIYAFGSND